MTELRTLKEEDLKEMRKLSKVLFEARKGNQTRVVDSEGATKVVIGTGDVTLSDDEDVPLHWPVERQVDVQKLRKHSSEQRKHLRWFNQAFEGVKEAGWRERYHILRERVDELEGRIPSFTCFMGGMISAISIMCITFWLTR